jgi:hypothetical protein
MAFEMYRVLKQKTGPCLQVRFYTHLFVSAGKVMPMFRLPELRIGNVNVKLSLCLTKHHSMKTYGGSGRTTPRILNLSQQMEVSGQLYVSDALFPTDKQHAVPIGYETGLCLGAVWRREKSLQFPCRESKPSLPASL